MNENESQTIGEVFLQYKKQREKSTILIEDIINSINRSTFFSTASGRSQLGGFVRSSTLMKSLDEDFYVKFQNLLICREKVRLCAMNLCKLLVEVRYLQEELATKIKQQTALEDLCCSKLNEMGENNIDQDALVSILSCFKFPPYFKSQEIDSLTS